MSRQIFEQHVDERGNVSVRISDECVVLTHEEAERIKAKFDQLQAENAQLRKLGGFMLRCMSQYHDCCDCLVNGEHCDITYIESDAQELGIEVGE